MATEDGDAVGPIRAVDRVISVLELFGEHQEMTMTEIARACGLSEPTVIRYLRALAAHGWIVHQPTGAYHLGIPLYKLGQRAVADLDVRRVARPPMDELLDLYGETVNLAIRQGDVIVVIESLESSSAIRRGASIGEQDYWFSSGLGKSILACLPRSEVLRLRADAKLVTLTEKTLTSLPALFADLDQVRANGYSLDNEESEVGLMCVASAIHDRTGAPRYALSVSGPAERIRSALERGLGDDVAKAARAIEAKLGHSVSA